MELHFELFAESRGRLLIIFTLVFLQSTFLFVIDLINLGLLHKVDILYWVLQLLQTRYMKMSMLLLRHYLCIQLVIINKLIRRKRHAPIMFWMYHTILFKNCWIYKWHITFPFIVLWVLATVGATNLITLIDLNLILKIICGHCLTCICPLWIYLVYERTDPLHLIALKWIEMSWVGIGLLIVINDLAFLQIFDGLNIFFGIILINILFFFLVAILVWN